MNEFSFLKLAVFQGSCLMDSFRELWTCFHIKMGLHGYLGHWFEAIS